MVSNVLNWQKIDQRLERAKISNGWLVRDTVRNRKSQYAGTAISYIPEIKWEFKVSQYLSEDRNRNKRFKLGYYYISDKIRVRKSP